MAPPPDPFSEEDDPQRAPRLPLGELLRRMRPYYAQHRGPLLLALGLLLGAIGLSLLGPLLLGQVIDQATGQGPAALLGVALAPGRPGLLALAALFVAVVGVGFLLEAALGLVVNRVGIAVVLRLKEDLFRHVLVLDPTFQREFPPGRLISRIEADTEALKNLFSATAVQLLRATLTFAGIFTLMLISDPETGAIVVPVLLGVAGGTALFVGLVRRYYQRSRRFLAAITAAIAEYVEGIEVIQHYGWETGAERALGELQRERLRADTRADALNYGFWAVFGFSEILAAALVLQVGAGKVVAGTMSLGTLVVFLEYLRQVFLPVQMLSEFVSQVQRGLVSAGRVFQLLGRQPTVSDAPDALAEVALGEELRGEGLGFDYPGGVRALDGVELRLPRGGRIGVVGPSGGGKSTLVQLLLRAYDPQQGRVTVDGVDLRRVRRSAWRRRVGLVPQEVHLFPGTLRENLTLFDEQVPDSAILAACRAIGLERLLERLPGGLEGRVAERGANLSQGERQLLSLARALVTEPELLVLDEATSSVDPATEAQVQAGLERLLTGRTALVIAHRLSTVRSCDRVLVLQRGRVREEGSPRELLEREGGLFRSLWSLQEEGAP